MRRSVPVSRSTSVPMQAASFCAGSTTLSFTRPLSPRPGFEPGTFVHPLRYKGRVRRLLGPASAATALFALLTLALLWGSLVGGRILTPGDVVYFTPPFAAERPPD